MGKVTKKLKEEVKEVTKVREEVTEVKEGVTKKLDDVKESNEVEEIKTEQVKESHDIENNVKDADDYNDAYINNLIEDEQNSVKVLDYFIYGLLIGAENYPNEESYVRVKENTKKRVVKIFREEGSGIMKNKRYKGLNFESFIEHVKERFEKNYKD